MKVDDHTDHVGFESISPAFHWDLKASTQDYFLESCLDTEVPSHKFALHHQDKQHINILLLDLSSPWSYPIEWPPVSKALDGLPVSIELEPT